MNPQIAGSYTPIKPQQALDTHTHLGGSIVGEGKGEDAGRIAELAADYQPHKPMGQHKRLAGARPSHHLQGYIQAGLLNNGLLLATGFMLVAHWRLPRFSFTANQDEGAGAKVSVAAFSRWMAFKLPPPLYDAGRVSQVLGNLLQLSSAELLIAGLIVWY